MATEIYRPYELDKDVSGTGTSWPHTIAKSSIDVWIDDNIPVGATINSITFACEAQKSRTLTFGGNVTVKVGNNTIINNVNINSTGYSDLINNDIKNCFGERYINDNIVFSFSCNQSCTFYLRNVVITFNYTIPTYKITTVASPSEGGAVSGGGTYNSGDLVTLTATPYTGWYTADWLKNGVSMGFENVGTFQTDVTSDVTYTAIFKKRTYTITWKNYDDSVIKTETVEYGTVPTYSGSTPTRPSYDFYNYNFSDWYPNVNEAVYEDTEFIAQFISERIPVPIRVNLEQVTGVYIVPDTDNPKTGDIVYVIDGTIPIVESENNATNGWNFIVSNTIPNNGYTLEKLYISNIRIY